MNQSDQIHRLKQEAASGNITAQYYLSITYEDARNVERDLVESAKWCLEAAQAGDRQSQYRFSKMLERGRGFEKPHLRAAWYWLEKAAQSGHVEARFELGIRFLFGAYGVHKSTRKAHTWLLASAHAYHAEANYYLGYMYLNGCGVQENAEQAFEYFSRGCELHSVKAKCSLALMLEHGIACEIDYERSQALYESAAQCGHTGAQMYLATLALMTADYTRAVTWLEQAAHAGLTEAQAFLVRLLSTGPQAVRNKPTALFWSLIAQQADAESVQSIQAFKNCLDSVVASATEAEIDLAKNKIISWHKERHMNPTSTETQQAGGNII